MLNYINKYGYLPKMVPLKQGSKGVMGIRGVWGDVRYDRDVVMAPHMEYLPRRCLCPKLWLVGGGGGPSKGVEEGVGVIKLKCQSVLQNLVPDVW